MSLSRKATRPVGAGLPLPSATTVAVNVTLPPVATVGDEDDNVVVGVAPAGASASGSFQRRCGANGIGPSGTPSEAMTYNPPPASTGPSGNVDPEPGLMSVSRTAGPVPSVDQSSMPWVPSSAVK